MFNFIDKSGLFSLLKTILTDVNNKADKSHTHNYASSSTAGGAATSANKLNSNAGSATNPVYFDNGVPKATTYTLAKSVPSNAVFTDTKYTHPSYTAKSLGLYKVTVDGIGHVSAATAVTKADITALISDITKIGIGTISMAVNTAYIRTISNISGYDFLLVKITKDFSATSPDSGDDEPSPFPPPTYTGKNESGANETVNFAGSIATSTDVINPQKDVGKLIQSTTNFGVKYGFPTSTKLYISNDNTSTGTLTYEIYGVKLGG